VDGIYIDITRQKIVGLKMKLMTIVLQKRTLIYQLVFGFLYSDRVNYVIGIGLCLLITLVQYFGMVRFIVSFVSGITVIALVTVF
jgi:hypothetical protein